MILRYFSIAFIILLVSCGSSKEDIQKQIGEAESALYTDDKTFNFEPELARNAISAYENYANNYSKDLQSVAYMFKAADLYRALKEYDSAIIIYRRINDNYPEHQKHAHSIFLRGFVYENEMNNLDEAKVAYDEFLEKYPEHELADDVKFSITNLGKTPEEIIREFEQKRKAEQQAEQADTLAL